MLDAKPLTAEELKDIRSHRYTYRHWEDDDRFLATLDERDRELADEKIECERSDRLIAHLSSWQDADGHFHDLTNPEYQVQPFITDCFRLTRDLAEARKALADYALWVGSVHERDCPEDDTCACKCKPINAAVNNALRDYPLPGAALGPEGAGE